MNAQPAFPDAPPEPGAGYEAIPLEDLEMGKYYFAKRRAKDFLDDYHIQYAIVRLERQVPGLIQHRALGMWDDREQRFMVPGDAIAWSDEEDIVLQPKPRGEYIIFMVLAGNNSNSNSTNSNMSANNGNMVVNGGRRKGKKTRKARRRSYRRK